MKKRLFSLFCVLALLLGTAPPASALEGESRRAAEALAALRLIDEVPSGEALKQPATRLQAAELLARLYGVSPSSLDSGAYAYAVSRGWASAASGQKEPIPTGEFCASLLRQLGYTEGFTDETSALFARRTALTTRDYGETLTLGDLCQLACGALPFPDAEGTALAQRLVEKGWCTQAEVQRFFPEELTARQAADRHMAAAFRLDAYKTESAYQNNRLSNGGSGFFVSAGGLAVTNYHAIDGAVRATANLITGECFEVERVIYYDEDADVALLKVSTTTRDGKTTAPFFSYLELAEGPDLRRGDQVYAIGAPLGITLAISDGVISAVDHPVGGYTFPCVLNTADISHGSSGGALMNAYGHVVGITTGAYSSGNNLYIAVPLTPILEADWTAEGITLAEVEETMKAS